MGANFRFLGCGMTRKPEVLFVDPSVPDVPTILQGLRPEVEVVFLDPRHPAARQISAALRERENLDAVHVIAHGSPGRVSFAAGEWSSETLERDAADLASIGRALVDGGELRLWSCDVGASATGAAFIEGLERTTMADVAAAFGRVGSAAKGGGWWLKSRSARGGAPPPLAEAALAAFSGVLDDYIQISSNGAPVTLNTGPFSLVARYNGKTEVIGQFSVLKGYPHNILVRVAAVRSTYSVYVGPDGNLSDGQITIHDSSGKYSRAAALALLGADGAAVAVRSIASLPPGSHPTASARVGD
jgi:hypothetical protein